MGKPSPFPRTAGHALAQVASREEDIPADAFPPYWREVLPEMLVAYGRRCAYLAMYIHPATGSPTVDHVLPKSTAWNQVYEWPNYRLCAAIINSKKGALSSLVDPFAIGRGWFALNLNTFHVERGAAAPEAEWSRVDATLPVLNHRLCVEERAEYLRCYWLGTAAGGFDLAHLEERAPFLAAELDRQGWLLQVRPGWFVLSPKDLRLECGPDAPAELRARISGVLPALNHPLALAARKAVVSRLPDQLERRAPFLASELRRQGVLA
ncbi:MAG: hypothetical protein QM765_37825 [Myxococcales bacterium]